MIYFLSDLPILIPVVIGTLFLFALTGVAWISPIGLFIWLLDAFSGWKERI